MNAMTERPASDRNLRPVRPAAHRRRVSTARRRAARGRVVRQSSATQHPPRLRKRGEGFHALHRHCPAGGISHRDARASHRLARRAGAARAWRQRRSGTGWRRSLRCSNISATRTPSPITRSKASSGQGRKAAKARPRRSAIIRRASCWTRRRRHNQEQARPRHPLHAAVSRACGARNCASSR